MWIVARISCSQRENSYSSTTSSSKTNPNAARTARASGWQSSDLYRTLHHAGIPTRRPRRGRTVRSAAKRRRCRFVRPKGARCCAANAFSRDDRSRAPEYSSIVQGSRPAGGSISAPWDFLRHGRYPNHTQISQPTSLAALVFKVARLSVPPTSLSATCQRRNCAGGVACRHGG